MEVNWVERKNEGNGEENLEGDEDEGPESCEDRELNVRIAWEQKVQDRDEMTENIGTGKGAEVRGTRHEQESVP